MPVQFIESSDRKLPIARATAAAGLLFVTTVPDDENGVVVAGSALEQSRLTLRNLRSVLAERGASLADVAHVTLYLPDVNDREAMTQAWIEAFAPTFPARATIGVAALAHPDIKVEMSAIAALDRE